MKLRWRKRKPATVAARQPKRIEITPEEVAELLALVAVMSDKFRYIDDDPEIQAIIDKARTARNFVHNGHKVTVAITTRAELD